MTTAEYKANYNDQKEILPIVKRNVEKYFEEELPQYDPHSVIIHPESEHPDDWYLFRVAAKRKTPNKYIEDHDWAAWTCWNETTQSLNWGHYDLTNMEAFEIVDNGI